MTPRTFTVVSALGQHRDVVLYPQPFGRGIDRDGNDYRIHGDSASPINLED